MSTITIGTWTRLYIYSCRNGTLSGLALDQTLKDRDAEAWCGILVVDLANGDMVEGLRLDGFITELFDVAVMPGVSCPMALDSGTLEIRSTITFDDATS